MKSTLEFFLNGKKQVLRHPDPSQTVLEYIRSTGLTGTKLGCQEGGCGACTLTLSEWNPEAQIPHYYAINGCIVPIIALDGKHVMTVEGIGNSEVPHAAQERIAVFHGSQCGFCTPGIVMSLYSLLRETEGNPSREQLTEAFDGNLCRCTGYKPIIDAASTFVEGGDGGCCGKEGGCCKQNGINKKIPEPHKLREYPHAELIFPPSLKKYQPELLELEDQFGHLWYRPTSLSQLVELLKQNPGAKMVGGASEFQIEAKIKGDIHQVCIYVLDVPELKIFQRVPEGVRIGGNIPLSDLENRLDALVEELPSSQTQFYQAVLTQLKYFAGRQIRNVATPAGNIATASPISDLNPVFVSANVKLEVLDPETGEISTIKMGEFDDPFFVGYRKTKLGNKLLTHITIPVSKEGEVVQSFKQAKRKDDDISIVTSSMYIQVHNGFISECRLAYGGVAPFTVLAKTSLSLVGQPVASLASLTRFLSSLDAEFALPYSVPGGMAVFRRSLIMSFFYKFVQTVLQSCGLNSDDAALLEVTRTQKPKGVRDLQNEYKQDILGQNVMHLNAMRQVTGEAQYVDDLPEQVRELHGVQVLSSHARAKITRVDFDEALAIEGVVGKVDISDVPGDNQYGAFKAIGPDRVFVESGAEYVGDTIAIIVATTRSIAEMAARKVKVEYEDDPQGPIVTIEDAIERNSFFNIQNRVVHGDFDKEWENAPYKFSGECRMGAQEHFYLEPQGAIAVPEDGGQEFKIYASSQNPNETQLVAASALNIPASRIVARVKRLGGGFGGKETACMHISTLAAVAANKFQVPVRMIMSRADDMVQSGQRHPFLTKWQVTLDENYKFTGIKAELYANAGYSMDLTKGVMDRATLHVDNCYDFGPNVDYGTKACRTNLASNTAFRGFGGPQGMFVGESIIYEVSEKLGMSDPEELRRINYYKMDGTARTPYLQWLGNDFTVPLMAEKLRNQTKYDQLRAEVDNFNSKSTWIKRGLSCIPTKFGIAFGAQFLNQGGALVHIYEDGSVLLTHGGTEMGQGLHTKMIMVCAIALKVPVQNVFISETATNTVANASPTAASASSDINGMAVQNACDQLNERLEPYRKKFGPDASMHQIAHAAYFDRVNLSANGFYKMPDIGYFFDNNDPNPGPAFQYFTQGVAISLVEVDTLTGDWANLRTDIIMDIGRPINQAIDYGQIEGGFVQGQGLFTLEESLWSTNGSIITRGPGNYKIPGFRDLPQHFNVEHLQNRDFNHLKTIHKSKGVGEPPLFLGCAPMFALRDAIKSAQKSHGMNPDVPIDAPFTTERIRTSIGDHISLLSAVEKVGRPFSVRS